MNTEGIFSHATGKILEQILIIGIAGNVDMFDQIDVRNKAITHRFSELFKYVNEYPKEYTRFMNAIYTYMLTLVTKN